MSSSPSGNGADAGAAIPNAQHKLIAALGDGMAEAAAGGKTFAAQGDLPKLPLPKLEDTARRYLASLQALQVSAGTAAASDEERGVADMLPAQPEKTHAKTKQVVEEFLKVCAGLPRATAPG
jgi:hypothetical protein